MNTRANNSIRLTAPEISSLWTQYIFDTMSICFFRYALEHIEDYDIKLPKDILDSVPMVPDTVNLYRLNAVFKNHNDTLTFFQ